MTAKDTEARLATIEGRLNDVEAWRKRQDNIDLLVAAARQLRIIQQQVDEAITTDVVAMVNGDPMQHAVDRVARLQRDRIAERGYRDDRP